MNSEQRRTYVGLINHFRNGVLFDLVSGNLSLSEDESDAADTVDEAIIGLLDVLDPEAQWDDVELEEGQIGNFGRCMLSELAGKGDGDETVGSE